MQNPALVEKIRNGGAWAFQGRHGLVAHFYLARNHHSHMCVSLCFKSVADLNEVDIHPVYGKCVDCNHLIDTVSQERKAIKS